jgi:spermidine synthase
MQSQIEMTRIDNGVMLKTVRVFFTITVFTSAFLLFAIQPMFTKMVLPQLGGSPAVWSVAMVFFQAILLLGYLYAHLSTRYLQTRHAVILHALLMLVTFLALPIAVTTGLGKPPEKGQMFWLICVFAASVGLPFFMVSANGPLLQAWFSRTGHKDSGNPYFLYAASNLGSFAALLLYPILFEITLRLPQQSYGWSFGFALLLALICASGLFASHTQTVLTAEKQNTTTLIAYPMIARYIWLAFIPSALLVAVTAHISTDVASAPFVWIIPLALFLLTFVVIFRDQPLVPMRLIHAAVPIMAGMILLTMIFVFNIFLNLGAHLIFFFATALLYHHRLYTLRPKAEQLTQFYLWMSFGGVLGGVFSGLLAPYLFNSILEYPILVSLVMLAHPGIRDASKADILLQLLPTVAIGLAITAAVYVFQGSLFNESSNALAAVIIIGSLIVIGAFRHNMIRAALIPFVFILLAFKMGNVFGTVFERSFFGVYRISINEEGQFRVLSHGTTVHGAMRIKNADGTPYSGLVEPITYYHPKGVLAETLKLLPANTNGRDIGIVGLGTGAQACNGMQGDRFTYFEIDALVVKIATDPAKFSFLEKCAPAAKIFLGDARLTLADQAAANFDYLLLDAFSSDTIPVHLLTREALSLYVSRLKDNGLLVIHISNRNMELQTVTASLAQDAGLAIKARVLSQPTNTLANPYPSSVVVIARKAETLAAFTAEKEWIRPADENVAVWADDYSNIAASIWRKYFN